MGKSCLILVILGTHCASWNQLWRVPRYHWSFQTLLMSSPDTPFVCSPCWCRSCHHKFLCPISFLKHSSSCMFPVTSPCHPPKGSSLSSEAKWYVSHSSCLTVSFLHEYGFSCKLDFDLKLPENKSNIFLFSLSYAWSVVRAQSLFAHQLTQLDVWGQEPVFGQNSSSL